MLHGLSNDELKQCTKEKLIDYINALLEENNYLATCNQDLQNIIERYKALLDDKDFFHEHYVLYARHTNRIQNFETQITSKGK